MSDSRIQSLVDREDPGLAESVINHLKDLNVDYYLGLLADTNTTSEYPYRELAAIINPSKENYIKLRKASNRIGVPIDSINTFLDDGYIRTKVAFLTPNGVFHPNYDPYDSIIVSNPEDAEFFVCIDDAPESIAHFLTPTNCIGVPSKSLTYPIKYTRVPGPKYTFSNTFRPILNIPNHAYPQTFRNKASYFFDTSVCISQTDRKRKEAIDYLESKGQVEFGNPLGSRYSVCIEDTITNNYFVMACESIMAWSIPIYYGAPNISQYLPEGSFIQLQSLDKSELDRVKEIVRKPHNENQITALHQARNLIRDVYSIIPCAAKLMTQKPMQLENPLDLMTPDVLAVFAYVYANRSELDARIAQTFQSVVDMTRYNHLSFNEWKGDPIMYPIDGLKRLAAAYNANIKIPVDRQPHPLKKNYRYFQSRDLYPPSEGPITLRDTPQFMLDLVVLNMIELKGYKVYVKHPRKDLFDQDYIIHRKFRLTKRGLMNLLDLMFDDASSRYPGWTNGRDFIDVDTYVTEDQGEGLPVARALFHHLSRACLNFVPCEKRKIVRDWTNLASNNNIMTIGTTDKIQYVSTSHKVNHPLFELVPGTPINDPSKVWWNRGSKWLYKSTVGWDLLQSITGPIDKVWCISCEDRDDRRGKFVDRWSKLGVPYEYHIVKRNTDPALGCLLSHIELIKKAKVNGYKRVLILEDDAVPDFDAWMGLEPRKLPNYDMLYLGYNIMNGKYDQPGLLKLGVGVMCTHSYIATNTIYDEILKFPAHYFTHPIDQTQVPKYLTEFFKKPSVDIYYTYFIHSLDNSYGFYPMLTTQDESFSDIEKEKLDYSQLFERNAQAIYHTRN